MRHDELLEEPLSGQAVNFRGPFQNGRSIAVRAVRRGDRSKGRLSGSACVLTIRQVSIGRIHREDENPQPQQVLTKIGGLSIKHVVLPAVNPRGAKGERTATDAIMPHTCGLYLSKEQRRKSECVKCDSTRTPQGSLAVV